MYVIKSQIIHVSDKKDKHPLCYEEGCISEEGLEYGFKPIATSMFVSGNNCLFQKAFYKNF